MREIRLENKKQLKGKCCSCLGCNRLEIAEFEGVDECENWMKGKKTGNDWIQEIKKNLGVEGEQIKINGR